METKRAAIDSEAEKNGCIHRNYTLARKTIGKLGEQKSFQKGRWRAKNGGRHLTELVAQGSY